MIALALRLGILAWLVGGGGSARVPSKHKRSAADDSKRFTLAASATDNLTETYSDRGSVCTATNIRDCGNAHCANGCASNFNSCIEALSCRWVGVYQNCGALHCSAGCGGNFQGCIQPYADTELEVQLGEYGFIARACVEHNNLLLKPRSSIAECMRLCDQRSDCKGFEYGVNYNGAGYGRPDDCHLQSSMDTTSCDGSYYNFDFYPKMEHVCFHEYRQIEGGCVDGRNLQMIHNSNLRECELRCSASSRCKSFEFGVNHGGAGYGQPNDCHLQSSANSSGCNGFDYNFDLYVPRNPSCQSIPSYNTNGEWVPQYAIPPEGVTRMMTKGSTRTDGHEMSSSVMVGMTKSVKAGFAAGGFSKEYQMTVSLTMETTIRSSTEDSSSNSTTMKFVPHHGAEYLWQWRFTYAQGDFVFANTLTQDFAQTVNRATPPRCLPGYFEADDEGKNGQFGGAQRCADENPDYTILYRS